MYGRMHLFSLMLDSEEILLGSWSTVNLTFHIVSYTIHSPFLSLVWKNFPERVLGSKYCVVYLSCIKCPQFADVQPLRKSPHLMVVLSVNASVMVAPCAPAICNHWWSWLVTVAMHILIVIHTSLGILFLQRAHNRSLMDAAKRFLYPYDCICRGGELFRFPVCSRGIDHKQWEFVSVYSVKRRFCFRIQNINHKLYKPALNLFRHLVNSDDGSLNILPVHCMEHIHLPIFPPLRYSSIPLVDDMVGSIVV